MHPYSVYLARCPHARGPFAQFGTTSAAVLTVYHLPGMTTLVRFSHSLAQLVPLFRTTYHLHGMPTLLAVLHSSAPPLLLVLQLTNNRVCPRSADFRTVGHRLCLTQSGTACVLDLAKYMQHGMLTLVRFSFSHSSAPPELLVPGDT